MSDNVDLTQALAAAQARRQAASDAEEQARKSQRDELVGDLLFDTQTVVNDNTLGHDATVTRLQAAIAGINGQGTASAAPTVAPAAPAPTGSAPFDYDSLSEEQRQIIDMVVAEGRRFKVEPSGAVKDKKYTQLNKNYQAQQAAEATAGDADDDSSTPPPAAKKAASPAPAKKAAPPKKTAQAAPEEASEPTDDSSAEKPGFLDRARAAGKAVRENITQ